MDPRNYLGNCEAKACVDIPPVTPIHEMLDKMTALSVDIKDHVRYIESSMFPMTGNCGEVYPVDEGCYNIHDAIKHIMNELVVTHDALLRIKNCL